MMDDGDFGYKPKIPTENKHSCCAHKTFFPNESQSKVKA
jgi:hypothetical protein